MSNDHRNLSIGIDHVAVSGLPAGARSGQEIGRGIERALGGLLESGGLPAGATPRDLARISLPALRLPANPTDAQIAAAVAAALHRALTLRER
jgi:hypothetical protein